MIRASVSSFGKTGRKRRSTERDNYEEEGGGIIRLYLSNTIYIYYNISIYHPPSSNAYYVP